MHIYMAFSLSGFKQTAHSFLDIVSYGVHCELEFYILYTSIQTLLNIM